MYLFCKIFLLMLFMVNSGFVLCIFESPVDCHAFFRCKGETSFTTLCGEVNL